MRLSRGMVVSAALMVPSAVLVRLSIDGVGEELVVVVVAVADVHVKEQVVDVGFPR